MTNTKGSALPARRLIGILMLAVMASTSVGIARAEDPPASGTTYSTNHAADALRWRGRLRQPAGEPGPTVPVPEPATMALTAMGLIAIGTAMRNRKK